jgi:hypothetical protein
VRDGGDSGDGLEREGRHGDGNHFDGSDIGGGARGGRTGIFASGSRKGVVSGQPSADIP